MPDPGTREKEKRSKELFLPERSILFNEDRQMLLKV